MEDDFFLHVIVLLGDVLDLIGAGTFLLWNLFYLPKPYNAYGFVLGLLIKFLKSLFI